MEPSGFKTNAKVLATIGIQVIQAFVQSFFPKTRKPQKGFVRQKGMKRRPPSLPSALTLSLWTLNIALGAGFVIFSFQFLLFPEKSRWRKEIKGAEENDIRLTRSKRGPLDVAALGRLPNPIRPASSRDSNHVPGAAFQNVVLTGTIPHSDPTQGFAILKTKPQGDQFYVTYGQPVRRDKALVPELRGWLLKAVFRNHALFQSGSQERAIYIEDISAHEAEPSFHGKKDPTTFKSRLVQNHPSRKRYEIDPAELDYIKQNLSSLLEEKIRLSTYSGEGVKIDHLEAGSLGALRGLQANDVIKAINGTSARNLRQIKEMFQQNRTRHLKSLSLRILRGDKIVTLDYRLKPHP